MDLKRYTKPLYTIDKISLTPTQLKFLRYLYRNYCFLAKEENNPRRKLYEFSAWTVHSEFKKSGRRISYKNVLVKIKVLHEQNLIQEVKGRYFHGAKFYRISMLGWVYLLIINRLPWWEMDDLISKRYDEDIIFELLLHPYFEKATIDILLKIRASPISSYVISCIRLIVDEMEDTKQHKDTINVSEEEHHKEFELWLVPDLKSELRSLIINCLMIYPTNISMKEIINALMDDEKFLKTLKDVKIEFDRYYNELLDIKAKKQEELVKSKLSRS